VINKNFTFLRIFLKGLPDAYKIKEWQNLEKNVESRVVGKLPTLRFGCCGGGLLLLLSLLVQLNCLFFGLLVHLKNIIPNNIKCLLLKNGSTSRQIQISEATLVKFTILDSKKREGKVYY
jgi:hypothetical protein